MGGHVGSGHVGGGGGRDRGDATLCSEGSIEPHDLNLVRIGCKTQVLHYSIRDFHISILLKIQYILSHLITS